MSEIKSTLVLCLAGAPNKRMAPTVVDLPFPYHKGLINNIARINSKKNSIILRKWRVTKDMLDESLEHFSVIDDAEVNVEI